MSSERSNSFCFKYLSLICGIKDETIDALIDCDYDSIHSLLALDLDIDLDQLPNVSMGQKSILRNALKDLKEEHKKLRNHLQRDDETVLLSTQRLLEKSLREDNTKAPTLELIQTEVFSNSNQSSGGHKSAKKSSAKKSRKRISFEDTTESTEDREVMNKMVNKSKAKSEEPEDRVTSCDICGDTNKVKPYSGGTACAACYQFFDYYSGTDIKLECSYDNRCPIDKYNRIGCRSCRWDKCFPVMGADYPHRSKDKSLDNIIQIDLNSNQLSVNECFDDFMESNGYVRDSQPGIELTPIKSKKKTKVNDICAVCGDAAKGKAFGVLSCNGCGIFFGRVSKGILKIENCIKRVGKCDISLSTRNGCRYCRYQACLNAGMSVSALKNSRKSNEYLEQEVGAEGVEGFEESVVNEDNEEEEEEAGEPEGEEAVLPNDSPTDGFDYASVSCGRSPDLLSNEHRSKRRKNCL